MAARKTAYIGGPMRGYPNWNFEAFHTGAKMMRAFGYKAIDPAAEDEKAGITPGAKITRDMCKYWVEKDVAFLLKADAIVLLPGWEHSTGATAELAIARWLMLRVGYLDPTAGLLHWEDDPSKVYELVKVKP